ncbi:UPF0307 protein PM0119 [Solanum tuberosum]|uniref:Kinesin heavy chain isolog n=1 Tax=Solanum tuberosum TaxID=4113 RepID=M1ALL1_SOLTU|nr:PREDICTED: UPF0307 protein PM0119 [Solanum tuberosum]KAH0684135.1 hypothetical protein KY289_021887 [Solanum tuberosum]KAH0694548.1 hypothetical protein KY285_021645 [Solanum tuberosum]
MANVMKPLMNWPKWHHYLYVRASFIHFVQSQSPLFSTFNVRRPPSFTASPSGYRQAHFRSGAALKSRESPLPLDQSESDSDSDEKTRKSRNEKKREARRAVRWAMDLAKFSAPQIKRILRVASTEQEIYEAVMLAKRLGPDVREGKRRQFSYIGRLLREVEPELMDGLIQATKDGDQTKFQALSGSELSATEDIDEEVEETEYEDDEESSEDDIVLADRWFDGLVNKDVDISKEIYSLSEVDFDRQELRVLVRKVQSIREKGSNSDKEEGKVNSDVVRAEKSLTRFLRDLAKQLHS